MSKKVNGKRLLTIKIGAADWSVKVHLPNGDQRFDLSGMTKIQYEGAREMVVDFWARENGFAEVYGRGD